MTKNTVYVAMTGDYIEGYNILGVFSTPKRAENAIKKYCDEYDPYHPVWFEEMKVNTVTLNLKNPKLKFPTVD